MFHVTPNGYFMGQTMGKFIMSKPDAKKLAIVAHTNDWARGYCDPAKEYVESQGGEVVLDTAMERGSTDATAQVLQIKAAGVDGVLGCLYQPELVVLLKDAHKYQLGLPIIGALGADFGQVVQQVGNPDAVNGVFFQGHLYKDKIGAPALDWAKELLLKYLTEDELPKAGDPTHFYYFGLINGIGVVEGFRRAGRELTRESYMAAIESLSGFDTDIAAGMVTITGDQHVGISDMYFNGLDENGNEVNLHRVRSAASLGASPLRRDEAGGRRPRGARSPHVPSYPASPISTGSKGGAAHGQGRGRGAGWRDGTRRSLADWRPFHGPDDVRGAPRSVERPGRDDAGTATTSGEDEACCHCCRSSW